MIVVDTSVWIDYLNNVDTPKTSLLDVLIDRERLAVGDLILCEILQGLRSDAAAKAVERQLSQFELVGMVTPGLAIRAAENYRALRTRGVTIRKTIDLLIGTFCIEGGHDLLHDDRDFTPMERHLGLRVI